MTSELAQIEPRFAEFMLISQILVSDAGQEGTLLPTVTPTTARNPRTLPTTASSRQVELWDVTNVNPGTS